MIKNAILELHKEFETLRKFVDILASEQRVLLGNEFEQLQPLSEAKTQVASQLTEIVNARRNSLLKNSGDNMETWITTNAPDSHTVWSEIRKLAAQAQNLNSINGELIHSRMRHNQQALSVLHNTTKNAAGLYGPDGQANLNNAGRHLGSG